jgi:hypothetical protein
VDDKAQKIRDFLNSINHGCYFSVTFYPSERELDFDDDGLVLTREYWTWEINSGPNYRYRQAKTWADLIEKIEADLLPLGYTP